MQIKEVSKRTELSIKTIRFYEERGLITPQKEYRNGKYFRNYREEDVERLQMVAVLRKCLFSIEQIKTMLEHPELTADIFTEYRDVLLNQRDLLHLLAEKAESVRPETLKDPETLARKLTITANPLPLPEMDVTPNFGRFDSETPEERQAAYLKWQREYRYRYLKWLIPLGTTLLVLSIVTLCCAVRGMSDNLNWVQDTQALALKRTALKDALHYQEENHYRCKHMSFGLYTQEGMPEVLRERVTEDKMIDSLAVRLYGAYSGEADHYRAELEQWVAKHGLEQGTTDSGNIFHQTMTAVLPAEQAGEQCMLVLYVCISPILQAVNSLMPLYGLVLFSWMAVLAIRATRGYGFNVRFIRNYGLRGTWNDAILSVDEENGNATMLTQQYTGMQNLVSMDYKEERK